MVDQSRPPPIEPFPAAHRTQDMSWGDLQTIFPFDWDTLNAEMPERVEQLKRVTRARVGLDHPDLKITQFMLGAGAVFPMHAEGAPGFYHVVGGTGEISVEGKTQTVAPGTTIRLNPYDQRQIYASADGPLKILWFRWAPDGDQRFITGGYYLTGANQHIQPIEAELESDVAFWGETFTTSPVATPSAAISNPDGSAIFAAQSVALELAKNSLGADLRPYAEASVFSNESETNWLDRETLERANFFWAKDIKNLGELLTRWSEVMRYKALYQAKRQEAGWDFNMSQMMWGPHARYVEHSHSIPEFYYMMSGPVEHWIEDEKHTAMPGDIFITSSYVNHQSQGITDGVPFRNISGSWAPNGDRSVFTRPFFIVEPLLEQSDVIELGSEVGFH